MDQNKILKVSMAFTLSKTVEIGPFFKGHYLDMTRFVKSDQKRLRNTAVNISCIQVPVSLDRKSDSEPATGHQFFC
jgi:hypothetical protein